MHAFIAVAFLCVMLIEWGSHSLAFAHAEPAPGFVAVIDGEVQHDDPCRTMTCCESRQNEQLLSNLSHHLMPFSFSVEASNSRTIVRRGFVLPPLSREGARGIFRPKDPLLHPPENFLIV